MLFNRTLNLDIPQNQSAFLWGARKTGKSTYLKTRFPSALYIDFLKSYVFEKYSLSPDKLSSEVEFLSD